MSKLEDLSLRLTSELDEWPEEALQSLPSLKRLKLANIQRIGESSLPPGLSSRYSYNFLGKQGFTPGLFLNQGLLELELQDSTLQDIKFLRCVAHVQQSDFTLFIPTISWLTTAFQKFKAA